MKLSEVLKKFIEGYLFADLATMTSAGPSKGDGNVGYPMLMSCAAGIEMLGILVALHKDDADMESQPIKIKLFGNDGDDASEADYFESFFNLSLSEGFVFWHEKDQEYRDALIRGLST